MDASLINEIANELRTMSGAYPVAFSTQAERIAKIVESSDWFSDQKHEAYLDGDRDGYSYAVSISEDG